MYDFVLKCALYFFMGLGVLVTIGCLCLIFGVTAAMIYGHFHPRPKRTIIDEQVDELQRQKDQDDINEQFFTIIEEYRNEIR